MACTVRVWRSRLEPPDVMSTPLDLPKYGGVLVDHVWSLVSQGIYPALWRTRPTVGVDGP